MSTSAIRMDAVSIRPPGTVMSMVLTIFLLALAWLASVDEAAAKPAFSAIAVDASNGDIVFASNIDSPRYPASLTKVMTLYVLFEDMRAGKVSVSSRLTISNHAAAQQPSKLGLKPGASITVKDAIGALVTKSANDIAVAVAEGLEGSESKFAERMTRTARAIGMTRTTFRNASGLPDNGQKTTARDMATLGLRIQRDFPREFGYFATRSFSYAGRVHRNHNRLLGRLDGIDGIKTGYIRISGFNLITSIERGGKRMVGVVMGGQTGNARNAYMTKMLNSLYRSGKLKPLRLIAAVAGSPPGYVAKPGQRAALIKSPPLPRPKPELAASSDKTTIAEMVASQQAAVADTAASDDATAQATSFQAVVVETASKSDSLEIATTGTIGEAAGQVGEKALKVAQPAEQAVRTADAEAPVHAVTWNIQIGAFPTPESARSRLDKVLATGIDVLDGKSAFTMKAEVSGDTVYRARLSGFDEKAARLACKQLKLKGVNCFALAPRS